MKSFIFVISFMLAFVNVIKADINYYISSEQSQLIKDCSNSNYSLYFALNLDESQDSNYNVKLVCFKGNEIVKSTYPLCNVNSSEYNADDCNDYVNHHMIQASNKNLIDYAYECFSKNDKSYFYYRELESGKYAYVCLGKTNSKSFEPCFNSGVGRYCDSYYQKTPDDGLSFYYTNIGMDAVGDGVPLDILYPPPASASAKKKRQQEEEEDTCQISTSMKSYYNRRKNDCTGSYVYSSKDCEKIACIVQGKYDIAAEVTDDKRLLEEPPRCIKRDGDVYCVSLCRNQNNKDLTTTLMNPYAFKDHRNDNYCIYSTSQMYEVEKDTFNVRAPVNDDLEVAFKIVTVDGEAEKEYYKRTGHENENVVRTSTTRVPITTTTSKVVEHTATAVKVIPENLTTTKSIQYSATAVKVIPENLTTTKSVEYSVTAVKVIPETTTTKSISSTPTAVKVIPENLTTTKSIEYTVTAVKVIPESTTTKSISSTPTAVKVIPENLTTTKSIEYTVTAVKVIPESTTTKVIEYTPTAVKVIPENLTTTKSIEYTVTAVKVIPEYTTTKSIEYTPTAVKVIPESTTTTGATGSCDANTVYITVTNDSGAANTVYITVTSREVVTEKVTVTVQPTTTTTKKTTTRKTTTTKKTTTTTKKSSQTSGSRCVAKYAQCGGIGYSGPTCCESGSECVVSNEYYSQCI